MRDADEEVLQVRRMKKSRIRRELRIVESLRPALARRGYSEML
jgi:hypothetical protein